MIIVVGETPSSIEINAGGGGGGGRIGDPSKMAAAQYVSSNRQRQSMGRLRAQSYSLKFTDAQYSMRISGKVHK